MGTHLPEGWPPNGVRLADLFVLTREQVHSAARQLLLVGFAGVVLGLPDAVPAKHGHQWVRGSAVLRCGRSVKFADAMRRAMLQAGLIAPISELVAEALGGVGLALRRHDVGQVAARRCVNDLAQSGKDGQGQPLRARFPLLEGSFGDI